MAKSATAKDVIYALQFTGARLVMRPAMTPGKPVSWAIEPGGIKVPASAADEARQRGSIVSIGGRDGEAIYAWGAAA